MALAIFGWLLAACVFAYQGVYILRTGRTTLFLDKRARAPAGLVTRLRYAIVCLLLAAGIIAILATALARNGVGRVWDWLNGRLGTVVFASFMAITGLRLVVQPENMLRELIRENPELLGHRSTMVIARAVGTVLFGIAAVFLATA